MEVLLVIVLIAAIIVMIRLTSAVSSLRDDTAYIIELIHSLTSRINELEKPEALHSVIPDDESIETESMPEEENEEPVIAVTDNESRAATPPPFIPEMYDMPAEEKQPWIPEGPKTQRNFEKLIGENLFSKIGILILVVGIGFFVKYAIDKDWISEVTRTILGIVAGLGLWGLAYPLRERYRNFSSVLAGGGFAVCFVTVAIACNFYDIFPPGVALAIMVALTALMITCAMILDRRELALVAVAGGFVAPFIASNPDGSYLMLMAYVAVLDCAVFVITMKKNWWVLPLVACIPTWVVANMAILMAKDGFSYGLALAIVLVYFLLFSLPLVSVMRHGNKRDGIMLWLTGMTVVNAFAYLAASLSLSSHIGFLDRFGGAFPLLIAAVNGAIFIRYYRNTTVAGTLQNLILGKIVIFSLLFWPIQFSSVSVIVSGLAVMAAVSCYVYTRTRRVLYHWTMLVVSAIVALTMYVSFVDPSSSAPWGRRFWSFAVCGISFITMAVIVHRNRMAYINSRVLKHRRLYSVMLWTGVLLLNGAMNQIYTHFVADANAVAMLCMTTAALSLLILSLATSRGGNLLWLFPGMSALLYALVPLGRPDSGAVGEVSLWLSAVIFAIVTTVSGIKGLSRRITGPLGRRTFMVYLSMSATILAVAATLYLLRSTGNSGGNSAALSISLAVCGTIQMVIGLQRHIKALRMTGLTLLGIVIAKLVIHDMWLMSPVGRILVFILLGVMLLLVSFLYQRLRTVLFDDVEAD